MRYLENKINHSVFIAYHGSYGADGTAEYAKQLQKLIDKNVASYSSYCGPDTNEQTYDKHALEVIPFSKLFLFVVNDHIAQTEGGQIDPSISKYIIEEINTFKHLVDLGLRSKKDFSILYVGNLLKTSQEIETYLKRLLLFIDPKQDLYKGNHFYLTSLDTVIDWVNKRINIDYQKVLLSKDYYPFKVLEEKAIYNINTSDASFMILMEKGMGKTTFVKRFASRYNDSYFVFPYFINENGDCSRENFYWSLVDVLREQNLLVPSCNVNIDEEFVNFLYTIKSKYFKNKKMVFLIDGIDNIPPLDDSLLSLFTKLNINNDGLCFVFTSRIYNRPVPASSYEFVSKFDGEKIIFNSGSPEYLKFLYDYFNDEIIGVFYENQKKEGINLARYFENIEPKNILSFSILMKLIGMYFEKYNSASEDLIKSLDASMKFYYNYIKEEYNETTLLIVKKVLASIAVSAIPLSLRDINSITGLSIEGDLFELYPFLQVFALQDKDNKFSFVHNEMKNIIFVECKKEIDEIMGLEYVEINSIPTNCDLFYDFLDKKYVYIKLLKYLLDEITEKEKERIINRIISIDFSFKWGKSPLIVEKELLLLRAVLPYPLLSNAILAKLYSLVGFDYHLTSRYSTSRVYFKLSYDLYQKDRELIYENLYDFVQLLTRYSSILQEVQVYDDAEKLYYEAMLYSEELYKRGELSERSLVFNWVCMSHVYSHGKNLKKQIKTIKYVIKRFNLIKRADLEDERIFLYFSYVYYFRDKKRYKKSLAYVDMCIAYYEAIDYKNDINSFLGNVMECYAIKSDLYEKMNVPYEVAASFIDHTSRFLQAEKVKCHFVNVDFDSRVNYAFARLYLTYLKLDDAEKYASAIIYCIDNMDNEERKNNIISKHENNARSLLKEIKERRKCVHE